ncbi:alpha/beta fold hydrolase [Variovorax sp. PAMC 28711]|uniref:alpha/beta fold hydrolase n=1 Tax=Variovorax sp. PAMC 28711 TaxID=1795631 RepID=UPI00078DB4BF|nr:alpha/beta fold hydrolase [Variovorax sp. PAMC 28711]AMM25443.1 twin-arginine translocation pathway signal [Variovorax sp. PAMC 28711]
MPTRRHLIASALATSLLAACSTMNVSSSDRPPIVFVHGNGDSAALWQTTMWRFESNGWPRDRLFAADQPYPLARDNDTAAQPGRTSTAESSAFLKAEVDKVLKATGASKVVLIGNSRGGNTIRNYVQNGGGAAVVSHVVLGGNPAHGIWAIQGFNEQSEFSGLSTFMRQLNAPKGPNGDEVTPGVKWLTLRSDSNDKYAQPDGVWIGAPGKPTNIGYDGPALKGATNVVLPKADHRETSFSPAAFASTWQFLTGESPKSPVIATEASLVLDGRLTGLGLSSTDPAGGQFTNNLALVGAQLAVYATDPATGARRGEAAYRKTIAADGRWGPFAAQAGTAYEFEITAPGYATTHIYRSPFARSSQVVNLRPDRILPPDADAKAIVIFTRPRGYFDAQRDTMRFDGQTTLAGVPPQGAGVSSSKRKLATDAQRTVTAEFNGEHVTGQTWPAARGHMTLLELTY